MKAGMRRNGLTRRGVARVLAGAGLALAAPGLLRAEAVEGLAAILARSGLGTVTGLVVADAATGRVLEAHGPDLDRPPASVVKIVTALWALETLGPAMRFRTEIRTGGAGGAPALVLAGGGDPSLDTDGLGDLAAQVARAGIRQASGLITDAGSLPFFAATEAGQPDHAGYNAAIGGLNLNFNRVRLAWGPGAGGTRLALEAPGERHTIPVAAIRAEIGGGRGAPVHRIEGGAEIWRVPRDLVAGKGSLWLPVRRPETYASDVFARLAAASGISIAPGASAAGVMAGRVLAVHESADLATLMRGMLRHSTNITAEAVGLSAARARDVRSASLEASGEAMTRWAASRWGLRRARFVNHSGLTTRSTVTAREMLGVLLGAPMLPGLLPRRPILDPRGEPWRGPDVAAKTGTMHFLRGYAGFVEGPRRLAFAILAADPAARAAVDPNAIEPPPGARAWTAAAREQENALLRRWARVHAGA